MSGWRSVPCASLSPAAPTQRKSTDREQSRGTTHEKCIFGGFWGAAGPCRGSRIRPGGDKLYCSGAGETRAVRLHLRFTFFGKMCFGVCSSESVPAFWSGHWRTGAVCPLWSAGALSPCPGVNYSRRRWDSRAPVTGKMDSGKYSEQRCSKASHSWNFLVSGEYLKEYLTLSHYGLISDHGPFCSICFVGVFWFGCCCLFCFKLTSLTSCK